MLQLLMIYLFAFYVTAVTIKYYNNNLLILCSAIFKDVVFMEIVISYYIPQYRFNVN